jgi:hypothetical protein
MADQSKNSHIPGHADGPINIGMTSNDNFSSHVDDPDHQLTAQEAAQLAEVRAHRIELGNIMSDGTNYHERWPT